jgi:uncharacterized membrane protein YphA (DoxX/SURF4 family)
MTSVVAAWERFWFAREETSTLAIVRIAYGLLMVGWGAALIPDLFTFFSDDGMLPSTVLVKGWSLLRWFPSDAALIAVLVVFMLAAICVVLGFFTRLAAAILFVTFFAFERRNPLIWNSGDFVIHHIAFFLALAPSGASLSVDRWRLARDRFWSFPARAPWALRLMQVQLSVIYIASVWAKVRGETWNDGTAVSYALRIEDLERFPLPSFVVDTELIANFLTYGTLAIELGVAILIWVKPWRRYVIPIGILLHLFIDYALEVGFFSYAMVILYLAFIPPETATRWLLALRERFSRSRFRSVRRLAGQHATSPSPGY